MKLRSLRGRFIGALLVIVSLLCLAFFATVAVFVEHLEESLLSARVDQELTRLAGDQPHDPGAAELLRYSTPNPATPADLARLPEALRPLPPGITDDVGIDHRLYTVGRRDLPDRRIYVAVDMEPVGRVESELLLLTLICVSIALALAALVGLRLAGLVTRPVARLSARVESLDPAQHPAATRLVEEFRDAEIRRIAASFDRYAQRVAEFRARERAFTENASHELRTPLAVILSALPLLSEDPALGEGGRRRLLRIERAASQMQQLLESLLFLAREDGGGTHALCDMAALLQDCVQAQQETIADKPLSLSLTVERPQRVQAPAGMVASVINNLIVNALHYTERGRVDVRLFPGGFSVQDSGSGIAAEELDRIFERRYRGAQSNGLGLGLYLVRRIVDRLGWTISVRSALGAGTCFEVRFGDTLTHS
jgi:signal transduction histidine kinase